MDRRVNQETKLRSPFLPWLDQVTPIIYVAHLASPRVVSFPEFRPVPLGLKLDLFKNLQRLCLGIVSREFRICQFHPRQRLAVFATCQDTSCCHFRYVSLLNL